ncbi:C40 family peptidase [Musicola paradisiaca]|uniref:NLP/P60 protein n=2 Tax=Musicola paradisiaca TaxID=69223 RepID=C6C4A7_MUSP7|nr:NLP/P60 protein [Musicola paradisiaca Ech703]
MMRLLITLFLLVFSNLFSLAQAATHSAASPRKASVDNVNADEAAKKHKLVKSARKGVASAPEKKEDVKKNTLTPAVARHGKSASKNIDSKTTTKDQTAAPSHNKKTTHTDSASTKKVMSPQANRIANSRNAPAKESHQANKTVIKQEPVAHGGNKNNIHETAQKNRHAAAIKKPEAAQAANKHKKGLAESDGENISAVHGKTTKGKQDKTTLALNAVHKKRYQHAKTAAMSKLMSQIGKHYQWGGSSPSAGFDCSGLVYYAYKDLVKIPIPRTANEMFHLRDAAPIKKAELESGDLVFFRITNRGAADHVGVYLGNGRFIQSPRSGADIKISKLSEDYWQEHYVGARRVVTPKTIR